MEQPQPATSATESAPVRVRDLVLFFFGNIAPSIGIFLMLHGKVAEVTWQAGGLNSHASFLLSGVRLLIFCPFLLFSLASLALIIFKREKAERFFVVRLGVYTGLVLAIHFCLVFNIVYMQVGQLFSWKGLLALSLVTPIVLASVGIPVAIYYLAVGARRVVTRRLGEGVWVAVLMLSAPCLAITAGVIPWGDADEVLMIAIVGPGFLMLAATPFWMAATFLFESIRVVRRESGRWQFRISYLLGIFAWLSCYMAAWRFAVEQALLAYSELPVNPPSNCYIATAAANGHPKIVKSWSVISTEGSTRVNAQLAHFKVAELALMSCCPHVHALARRVYDAVGPSFARIIASPVASDATYFALKPIEWALRLCVCVAFPSADQFVHVLYRRRAHES